MHVPNPIHGYSVSLQVLGTLLLWFGWYGFNAGSVTFVSTAEYANVAALATLTTTISAASGTITSLALSAYQSLHHSGEIKFDTSYALNGTLSALVGITGACAVIEPWAALVIGSISGIIYVYASQLLVYLRIDDAVDAIPVHLFNGIWGVIAVGLFASPRRLEAIFHRSDHVGWFYSWGRGSSDATLLGTNIVGLLFIMGFVSFIVLPFFAGLMYLGWFRSDPLEEIIGLDCRYHRGIPMHPVECNDSDDGVADDVLGHTHHSDKKAIDVGKASGAYLHKNNRAFTRTSAGRVVAMDDLVNIRRSDDTLICDSNETAPSSTIVSDPTPTRQEHPDYAVASHRRQDFSMQQQEQEQQDRQQQPQQQQERYSDHFAVASHGTIQSDPTPSARQTLQPEYNMVGHRQQIISPEVLSRIQERMNYQMNYPPMGYNYEDGCEDLQSQDSAENNMGELYHSRSYY